MGVALGTTNTNAGAHSVQKKLNAEAYISLYDLVNKPDNRDALIKTYGDQGITGFLTLVGASKAQAVADEVQYWEEERLHKKALGAMTSGAYVAGTGDVLRTNDVVLLTGGVRAFYNGTALVDLSAGTAIADFAEASFPVIGNLYAQGSDQPSEFLESGIIKRTNPFMIMKEVYSVTGSQATNIGWIDLGNGDYRWYLKSESDQRQRFMDKREMMMLLGERSGVTGIAGSEGYFTAIEDRGIVQSGVIDTIAEIDDIVKIFDKQGAASEYALYVNREQDLSIDDMLAGGQLAGATALTTVGAAAFGSFNNSADTALNLGFRSFARGGYTFHKHDWKLLNDPTLLADSAFLGVGIPMSQVADAKTGDKAPALEMNYKAANGYSREMEHWMVGSILGASNATKDNVEFHYRSECNLVTRAANRHLLIKRS
tara:strand:- start:4237 stop:5520 length:1284 start_codon:yes stop_codon:yes gene_type:complete